MSQDYFDGSLLAASDVGKQLMDNLFGPGWNLFGSGGEKLQGTFLFDIFGAFCLAAMVACTVMLAYSFFFGLIGTAHEGKPLGRKFHTIWGPMRSALAIGMLAPVIKGTCMLQILMLSLIGSSMHFGNYIWERGLDSMSDKLGTVQLQIPDELEGEIESVAKGVLTSLALQEYYVWFEDKKHSRPIYELKWVGKGGGHYVTERQKYKNALGGYTEILGKKWVGDPSGYWQLTFTAFDDAEAYKEIDEYGFGYVTIEAASKTDKIGLARRDAMQKAISKFADYAANVVIDQHNQQIGAGERKDINVQTIRQILDDYVVLVRGQLSQIEKEIDPQLRKQVDEYITSAKAGGFFLAGAHHMRLANLMEIRRQKMESVPVYHAAAEKAMPKIFHGGNALSVYGDFLRLHSWPAIEKMIADYAIPKAIHTELDIAQGQQTKVNAGGITGTVKSAVDKMTGAVNKHVGKPLLNWSVDSVADGDLIITASTIGHRAINVAEYAGLSMLMAYFVGDKIPFVGKLFDKIFDVLKIPLYLLFGVGVLLAFYIPAIPLFTWVSAVIGQIVLFFEALLAAPLWAVAHTTMSGEGMAGDQAKQGYWLLFNVLLRAPLLVAGFWCAIALCGVIGPFLGELFKFFLMNQADGHMIGIVSIVAYMIIFGVVCIIAVQSIFKIITYLPESVIKWAGQQVQNLGEFNSADQAKGMVIGGFSKIGGAGKKIAGKMGGGESPADGLAGKTKSHGEDLIMGETLGKTTGGAGAKAVGGAAGAKAGAAGGPAGMAAGYVAGEAVKKAKK